MSDQWGGPGWWIGGDGKWHPPRAAAEDQTNSGRWGASGAGALNASEPQGLRRQFAAPRPLDERAELEVRLNGDPEPGEPVTRETFDVEEPLEVSDPGDVPSVELVETAESDRLPSRPVAEVTELADVADEADEQNANSRINVQGDEAVANADDENLAVGGWPKIDLRDEIEQNRQLAGQGTVGGSVSKPAVPSTSVPRASVAKEAPVPKAPAPKVPTPQNSTRSGLAESDTKSRDSGVSESSFGDAGRVALPALQETEGVPFVDLVDDSFRRRTGPILLALATILAVLCGLLGALWLRERSAATELRAELGNAVTAAPALGADGVAEEPDETTALLEEEIQSLQAENDELAQQLVDMSALVLELPPGRVSEIEAPFAPAFADEQDGRLVAVDELGSYAVWGEGIDGGITETGELGGTPTSLFISRNRAWVSTESTGIGVLTLANDAPPTFVDYGPARFLAEEERSYWTYNEERAQVARINKADGSVTNSLSVPSVIVDMTIGAGSVWALGEDGLVYRINTADFTVQALDLGEAIISVTAGPDSLWALSAADGALQRIDPVTSEVLVSVPVGRDPVDAAFAGNSVWVALRAGQSLIEVDTRTSAVVTRTALPSEPLALHQGEAGVFVTMENSPLTLVSSRSTDDEG